MTGWGAVDPVIREAMEETYGSVTAPDFGRMARRLRERPHARLIEVIGSAFTLVDNTDPNHDHGSRLWLGKGGHHWALELSVVGPFAVLARASVGWDHVITGDRTPGVTDDERWLVHRVLDHDLRLLGPDELREAVPMPLFGVEPGQTVVYHALFQDVSTLPWSIRPPR